MKINLCIALLLGTLTFSGATKAQAQQQQNAQATVQAVEALYSQVYAMGNNPPQNEASKQAAYCDIASHIDYPALSEALADRHYAEAADTHRERFNKAMKGMFASLLGEQFSSINFQRAYEVNPRVIKKSSGDIQVQTKLPFGDTDITNINYVMRNTSGQWLIYDALVKGISLQSQKYADFKEALDRIKRKYQDSLNQYAAELEKNYTACP